MAKAVLKLKDKDKACDKTRGKRICGRFWSINTHAEAKGFEFGRIGNSAVFQEHHRGYYSQRRSVKTRGRNSVSQRIGFIRDSGAPQRHVSSSLTLNALRTSLISV